MASAGDGVSLGLGSGKRHLSLGTSTTRKDGLLLHAEEGNSDGSDGTNGDNADGNSDDHAGVAAAGAHGSGCHT